MVVTKRSLKESRKAMKEIFKESQEVVEPDENENSGEVKTFDFYLELPEGTKRWFPEDGDGSKEKPGEYFFDIVPYVVGKKYPTEKWVNRKGRRVIDRNCNEGDLFYKLDIWYHKKVGPENLSIPCDKRNYGKPCSICEWVEEQRKVCDEDENRKIWSDYGPKRQSVYNVFIVDEQGNRLEEDIHVFNVADFYMEDHLRTLSKPRRGGIIYFADPDDGKTIFFKKTKGADFPEFSAHEFLDRDYVITDEEMEKAVCLDECIKEYDYNYVKKISGLYEVHDEPVNSTKTESKSSSNTSSSNGTFTECPQGGDFGTGYDNYKECDDCHPGCKKACRNANQNLDVPF